VLTTTNKRLLISESRDDSNWCTPCTGNLINMPHTFHTRSVNRPWPCVSRVVRIYQPFASRQQGRTDALLLRKKCSRHHLWTRLGGQLDPPQFLSQHNHWSSVPKPRTCWWQATRLTRPISPACDQYLPYLLVGSKLSILNRHRWGLQPWRCRLAISHSPTFPTDDPPLST
jgi:hypothetical protein